ncbi:butyrophilin subfamily 1 member A1-like [Chanos chanos]|uniref:Butyrophilin subfamily 1 member A1-like n=1 Tax=Chanos chanos TaxID=29144 RepID=A0A6J2WJ80_CHACN|nr:butyrophilin subfamily 1 member A1-like [Chanos chanos]
MWPTSQENWDTLAPFIYHCTNHSVAQIIKGPDTFSVVVPDSPVSAKLGSSVVLLCSLSPSFSAVELEVRWYRPNKFNTPVLLYKDQKIQESPVDPQYRDRVSLIGNLEEGNVSLKMKNITLSDRGEYVCYVSSGTWYEKGTTSLTVNILGSVPVLSFTETGEQVNVTCVSDGWSPQPTVTWRDREGKEIKHNSNVMYKTDSDDLVSVSSWLLFSPSESEWISCSVSLSDQEEREGRIVPHRTKISNCATQPTMLEPTASKPSWRAFIVMLVISLLAFSVLFILLFILYKKRDWDKMRLSKKRLTLDKTTSHKGLTVKNKGKEVSFDKGVFKHSISSGYMVDVLCKEMFKSDCHYWEVIVLDVEKGLPAKLSWYVGVTSHEEKERKKETLTPENGYWVLQYERGKGFYVNTGLPTPVLVRDSFSTLGVYLDMTKNTLSFYDVDSKSHLYTFTDVKSKNVLIPLFSPGDRCDHSLILKYTDK